MILLDDSGMTYLIYARRSSDREDHQILSIEQQVETLQRLAAERGVEIAEVMTESASAKDPGRPIFTDLIKKIRNGKVAGLLVWRLDRLARNMVDGGEIIYELSQGRLQEIITPDATYTGTGDAKFMLAMLFGAAAKYTDDLSAAVRRGNQDVLRKGQVPGPVPLGYVKTHEHELAPGSGTVIPDPERFELVKRLWQEVLGGATNMSDLWRKARNDWGLTTRPTKAYSRRVGHQMASRRGRRSAFTSLAHSEGSTNSALCGAGHQPHTKLLDNARLDEDAEAPQTQIVLILQRSDDVRIAPQVVDSAAVQDVKVVLGTTRLEREIHKHSVTRKIGESCKFGHVTVHLGFECEHRLTVAHASVK